MKNIKKPVADETIIVMGMVVRKSVMPHIFGLATRNKAQLQETVSNILKTEKWGPENAGSVMAILESDLG